MRHDRSRGATEAGQREEAVVSLRGKTCAKQLPANQQTNAHTSTSQENNANTLTMITTAAMTKKMAKKDNYKGNGYDNRANYKDKRHDNRNQLPPRPLLQSIARPS
jgi:hypothetical protein